MTPEFPKISVSYLSCSRIFVLIKIFPLLIFDVTGFSLEIGKVGQKDHQRFQASYATILKAHMTALKKRERKDKKKPAEAEKREGSSKRPMKS